MHDNSDLVCVIYLQIDCNEINDLAGKLIVSQFYLVLSLLMVGVRWPSEIIKSGVKWPAIIRIEMQTASTYTGFNHSIGFYSDF